MLIPVIVDDKCLKLTFINSFMYTFQIIILVKISFLGPCIGFRTAFSTGIVGYESLVLLATNVDQVFLAGATFCSDF